MKVKMVQMAGELGNLQANLDAVTATLQEDHDSKAFYIFPELALTGYSVGPRYHECSLRVDSPEFQQLVKATKGASLAVGFVEETRDFSFYNSLALIRDEKLLSVHRKVYLPNYGIFDERKYFKPGVDHRCADMGGLRIAPFICGDAWSPAFIQLGVARGAHVILFSVGSPEGGLGQKMCSKESWKRVCRTYATMYGCYVIFVNRIGRENDLNFWGQSEIIDPFGERIAGFDGEEEGIVEARIDIKTVRAARTVSHTLRDENYDFLAAQVKKVQRYHEELYELPS